MSRRISKPSKARITAPSIASLRAEALAPAASGIAEIFKLGGGRPDVIPLWVGEGDLPTPTFARDAARRSLEAGETFYTPQRGLPELRAAITRYMSAHYAPAVSSLPRFSLDHFCVTAGGMHALQVAFRLVAGPGSEVVVLTPAWPNFAGALLAVGAEPVEAPLEFADGPDGFAWRLDIDRLASTITPEARAIIVNTPGNPTGWMATQSELAAILELARARGLWIIADEIYGRLVYDAPRAPSFHDVMTPDDRVMFVQTMSKNWAMTGLRVGWLEAPPQFASVVENLIHYSITGVPTPIQRAAAAALDDGESFIEAQVARMRKSRDILCGALAATGRVRFARPAGAFYLFCEFEGFADSRELAFRLLEEAKVGVAPGAAFGAVGETFLRLCFARDPAQIEDAAGRIVKWLKRT